MNSTSSCLCLRAKSAETGRRAAAQGAAPLSQRVPRSSRPDSTSADQDRPVCPGMGSEGRGQSVGLAAQLLARLSASRHHGALAQAEARHALPAVTPCADSHAGSHSHPLHLPLQAQGLGRGWQQAGPGPGSGASLVPVFQ